MLRGRAKRTPDARAALRVRKNGKFKIVQIVDTHMVTDVGIGEDAIDADGNYLPESEADPLTVNFIEKISKRRCQNPTSRIMSSTPRNREECDIR